MYKIGFILVGDKLTGSSRWIGYNTHEYLLKQGVMSSVLLPQKEVNNKAYFDYHPVVDIEQVIEYDIIFFQKVRGRSVLEAIEECKRRRIKTVYSLDDWRVESAQMGNQCDVVITTTDYIKSKMFAKHKRAIRIQNAYEGPPNTYKNNYKHRNRLCYVYSAHFIPDNIKPLLKDWNLITIGRHKTDTHKWDISTVYNNVMMCDVGIVPVDISTDEGRAKSNNRALLFMSLGLPVICSAVPDNYTIIKNGINGFIAYTEDDWNEYLKILQDPIICEKMGRQARKDVEKYSIDFCGKEYHNLFYQLAKERWYGRSNSSKVG